MHEVVSFGELPERSSVPGAVAKAFPTGDMLQEATHAPKVAEDVAMDVSRLMDEIAEEVKVMMMESVHKTASYCASLCAERMVAARRDMQQRWAAERRELQRLYCYTHPEGKPSHFAESPATTARTFFPFNPAALSKHPAAHRSLTHSAADLASVPNSARSTQFTTASDGRVNSNTFGFPNSVVQGASPWLPAPADSLQQHPRQAARRTRSGPSRRLASTRSLGDGGSAHFQCGYPEMTSSGDCAMHHASFEIIDTYDAVQALEENTSMATHAMDLLDQALNAGQSGGRANVGPAVGQEPAPLPASQSQMQPASSSSSPSKEPRFGGHVSALGFVTSSRRSGAASSIGVQKGTHVDGAAVHWAHADNGHLN